MSSRRISLRGLLIVGALCLMALGSLAIHSSSIKLTRIERRLDIENRLLGERIEGLNVELVRLVSFSRLDSLWLAQGRPAEPIDGAKVSQSGQSADVAMTQERRLR
ncbi:MAG: hypothetical protein ABIK44_03525 [candidate division WOR-3 bacterium]